jgi:hypothetical protein
MTDEQVDKVLRKASRVASPVDPALLKRIAESLSGSLRPVRPLPPRWLLTSGLALICALVAVTAAAHAGFYGVEKLMVWERVAIFSTLAILVWVAGTQFVSQLIPASRQALPAGAFVTIGSAALVAVFALVFSDYHTDHFIAAGLACLGTGLLFAIPAALLGCLLLRRGYAVNPVAAGLAGGTLAGLCGVTMLELHCANFQAWHVLVWHTAVLPVSAAVGALVGYVVRLRAHEALGRTR